MSHDDDNSDDFELEYLMEGYNGPRPGEADRAQITPPPPPPPKKNE
jgi:hypothetical protein